MDNTIRIAMWSGPRNISTALLRSWENRPDTFVSDEPFYAHYLQHTQADHPGRQLILDTYPHDLQNAVDHCSHATSEGCSVHYQKHMTHHMLDHIPLEWLQPLTNVFLIRHPADVIASYLKAHTTPTIDDLGLMQQLRLFNYVTEHCKQQPLVINSNDLRANPERTLKKLCEYCNLPFVKEMLSWPKGPRNSDGVWATYWYDDVVNSTGFKTSAEKPPAIPPESLTPLLDECLAIYRKLEKHEIKLS